MTLHGTSKQQVGREHGLPAPAFILLASVIFASAPGAMAGSSAPADLAVRVLLDGSLPTRRSVAVIRPSADPRRAAVLAEADLDEGGRARVRVPRGNDLVLALRIGRELLSFPVPDGASARVDLRGRELRLRVIDGGSGEPVPGAVVTCIDGEGRPAPLRVFWLEGGGFSRGTLAPFPGTEAIPFGPGMLAATGEDGLLDVFLPPGCPRLRITGPPAGGHLAYRAAIVEAVPGDRGVVRLARAGGVTLVPRVEGKNARRMKIVVFPWPRRSDPTTTRKSVLSRPLRPSRMILPEKGEAVLLVTVPGFAPVLAGPFRARDDWPEVAVIPRKGSAVRWDHVPAAATRNGHLLDERGRDWWPFLDKAIPGDGSLRIESLPAGTWRFELGGGACRGEVHVPPGGSKEIRVSCPPGSLH